MAIKKIKTTSNKHNTPKKRTQKTQLSYAETIMIKPSSEKAISQFADDLLNWVEKDEKNITLEKYYAKRRVRRDNVFDWAKKSKKLQDALYFAKMIIGTRREEGMLYKELDSRGTAYCMHNYLERYKDADAYHDKRKQQQTDSAIKAMKEFGLPTIPSSPEVPEKPKDTDG